MVCPFESMMTSRWVVVVVGVVKVASGRGGEREMVDVHRRKDGGQRREGSMATKWEEESVKSVVDGREKRETGRA